MIILSCFDTFRKESFSINKKTAFDSHHKILASLCYIDKDNFIGITKGGEIFFLNAEKERKVAHYESRKRRGSSKTRMISNDYVAVIVVQD